MAQRNLWTPEDSGFTDTRRIRIARRVAYAFLTYFMVSEEATNGWSALDAASGCQYYSEVSDALVDLAARNDDAELEEDAALVAAQKISKEWINPLLLKPREGGFDVGAGHLLAKNSPYILAPTYRALLKTRLDPHSGSTPGMVAAALKRNVARMVVRYPQ